MDWFLSESVEISNSHSKRKQHTYQADKRSDDAHAGSYDYEEQPVNLDIYYTHAIVDTLQHLQ